MSVLSYLRNALAFLTVLPVGYDEQVDTGPSFAWYPLVGALLGGALCITLWLMQQVFSPQLAAFIVLVVWVVFTGGLHLDGLADSSDGLLATVIPERRLEIMKDPRTGSWAVISLILLLMGKWVALGDSLPALLIMPPVLGRWGIVWAVWIFPYGRSAGMGAFFRKGFRLRHLLIASAWVLFLCVPFVGWLGYALTIALLIVPVIVWLGGRWAATRLGGGLTGDIYGALCEVIEFVVLVVMLLWVS